SVTDAANQTSGQSSASASTPPCPQPTVSIVWNGSAGSSPSGCSADTTCTYSNMSVANFPPGTYTAAYYDDSPGGGNWWNQNFTVGANGTGGLSDNNWYGFGGHHYHVWVIVSGHRSNTLDSYGNPKYGP